MRARAPSPSRIRRSSDAESASISRRFSEVAVSLRLTGRPARFARPTGRGRSAALREICWYRWRRLRPPTTLRPSAHSSTDLPLRSPARALSKARTLPPAVAAPPGRPCKRWTTTGCRLSLPLPVTGAVSTGRGERTRHLWTAASRSRRSHGRLFRAPAVKRTEVPMVNSEGASAAARRAAHAAVSRVERSAHRGSGPRLFIGRLLETFFRRWWLYVAAGRAADRPRGCHRSRARARPTVRRGVIQVNRDSLLNQITSVRGQNSFGFDTPCHLHEPAVQHPPRHRLLPRSVIKNAGSDDRRQERRAHQGQRAPVALGGP